MSADLDDLLDAALRAQTDAERATVGAAISQVPQVIPELLSRILSRDLPTRLRALHFVSRLAPPPEGLEGGIVAALEEIIDPDPHSDERALLLVASGLMPLRVAEHRAIIAQRVAEAGSAEGPRREIFARLGRDTLEKIDGAVLTAQAALEARAEALAAEVRAGAVDRVAAEIARIAAPQYYPELARANAWERVGDRLRTSGDFSAAKEIYGRALGDYRWHAAGASAGAEGMARMLDVHRLEAVLASLG
ncbi:MAG: hypothetical protein U1E65_17390 [Myxococcota bacterium]